MSSSAASSAPRAPEAQRTPRTAHLAAIVFLGVVPVLAVVMLFAAAIADDSIATDYRQFHVAGQAILDGESPYSESAPTLWGGPYPYPPLPALVATPLTALPFDAAGVVVMLALLGAALATLFVIGVRDWRCYGIALLWPPTISAIQTGNVTLWFALALALAWRFRDRQLASSASIGVTLAAKFFLWPVVVWLAAMRRYAAAAMAVLLGAALLVLSWAVIGFAGLRGYLDLVERLEETVGEDSYTAYIVAVDAGLPSTAARALWLAIGLGLLGLVVALARRSEERAAFVVAVAASLALTPIVWLHYFALLVVIVAVARPRLGIVWFIPLGMVLTPGSGHPSPFETSWTLAIAALTVALAVRECRRDEGQPVFEPAPAT
jgi:hypothetical protein